MAGFLARITGGLLRDRTFQAGSGMTITNPAGDAGNPSFSAVGAPFITTSTGTLNDLAAGNASVIYMNNATLATVTGLDASTALNGQTVIILSKGAGQVDIPNASGSSLAANRFKNLITTAAISLAPGIGVAEFVYDSAIPAWRCTRHEQGWIVPGFSAGDYTGLAPLTWTVGAGDVLDCRYNVSNTSMTLGVTIQTSTLGGTTSTVVKRVIPGGYSMPVAQTLIIASGRYLDGGGVFLALCAYANGADPSNVWYFSLGGANFALGVDNFYVQAEITFQLS